MAPKQAPGGRPHSGEGSVTHRRQPLKSQKSHKKVLVAVYGSKYWKRVINFDAMQEMGTIDASDRKLFRFADSPTGAFDLISSWLEKHYL